MVTGLENVSFHSNPKERQCQECSNYNTTVLISHASKVTLKILQARLPQYMNQELLDVEAGFRKVRGSFGRDQIANIHWITEKARQCQQNLYFSFTDFSGFAKTFDCVDHNKPWKILQKMGIPNHVTCLLKICMQIKNQQLELDMEQQTDWFQIGKGVCQGCILSPCLFNFYAEYIMRNAGLDEAQAGIKIAGGKYQ